MVTLEQAKQKRCPIVKRLCDAEKCMMFIQITSDKYSCGLIKHGEYPIYILNPNPVSD